MARNVVRLAGCLAALALAGCVSLEPRPELPVEVTPPPDTTTTLDRLIAPAEEQHPGASAFRLVREGPEAFAIRARTALLAERSLDVQTYIWHEDGTGSYLGGQLLAAADRGVHVRLLIDDFDARAKDAGFAALDAHPHIEVRLFNPFKSRGGAVQFALEALGSFSRINRRMHNKSWIADNRVAIVGGRNLGDEYFGASNEVNFVDLDFAMIGPVVREASASFDRYWNSPVAYPIALLAPQSVTPQALDELRSQIAPFMQEAETSRFAAELRASDAVQRLLGGDWPMEWAQRYRFVADDPLKALGRKSAKSVGGSDVLALIADMLKASRSSATVISPYFVPGKVGTEFLVGVDAGGSTVRILTNSLAANDVALVYGGYSQWRRELLDGGVEIWELKPTGSQVDASFLGSSGASLHTKALTVDGRASFVGSYNLDPRSTSLNCEQGVFVDQPVIAAQLEAFFREDSAGERAWQVTLDDGELVWSDGIMTYDSSPEASAGRRFQAWIAQVLPLSSQL